MMKENILDLLEKQLGQLLNHDLLPAKTYLAGGTAVYLYFKHRASVDLDFFTSTPFNTDVLVHRIKECFDDVVVEIMEKDTVILYISKDKLKFSLYLLPYKNLTENQTITLQDGTICPLASLEDIEAMKAVAISQRGSVKDFVDLYHLVKKTGHCFNDILKLVIDKYELDLSYEYHLKTSFIYFQDAEKEVNNILMVDEKGQFGKLVGKEWQTIKTFFTEFVK
jgi:predicted nucleotidyltransferase component of viral defense system